MLVIIASCSVCSFIIDIENTSLWMQIQFLNFVVYLQDEDDDDDDNVFGAVDKVGCNSNTLFS